MGAFRFYRVYEPENNVEALNIPQGFLESIKEDWLHKVTLRDQYNNPWQLKVEKVGDIWYFKGGWRKFVEKNFVEPGNMLVFEYNDGVFQFNIFGANSCEAKGVGGLLPNNTKYQKQKQDDDSRDQVADGATANGSRLMTRRITDWFDPELFKSGMANQPTNPYFVTRAKLCRDDELYVPKPVVELHNLNLPRYTVFIDDKGEEYPSKLKVWKDGRMFYGGGWKKLCSSNLVGVDDNIICEFIRGLDGQLYINVSFVRANRN